MWIPPKGRIVLFCLVVQAFLLLRHQHLLGCGFLQAPECRGVLWLAPAGAPRVPRQLWGPHSHTEADVEKPGQDTGLLGWQPGCQEDW